MMKSDCSSKARVGVPHPCTGSRAGDRVAGPKKENRGRTRGDVGGPRKRSINYKRLSRVSLF